ncbi:MAG: hypothetical protein O7G86_11700, partial [Gammaproteobacteria bacterium]|nr:hypothetical protein [Gammaproteobacteria bacterium]
MSPDFVHLRVHSEFSIADSIIKVRGEDPESIACLQEIFGYFLLPDISQQKIFLLNGPKRGGKG